MATNRELREEAAALAAELGDKVDTERLSNQALSDLVDSMRSRATARRSLDIPPAPSGKPLVDGDASDADGGQPDEVPDAPRVVGVPYSVAPGRSMTSPRGVLGPREEVFETDVSGAYPEKDSTPKDHLEFLVQRGLLIKGPDRK